MKMIQDVFYPVEINLSLNILIKIIMHVLPLVAVIFMIKLQILIIQNA